MSNKRTKKRNKLWSVTRIKDPRYPGLIVRVTELERDGNLYIVRMVNGKQKMASTGKRRQELGTTPKEQEDGARALALATIESLAKGSPLGSQVPVTGPGEIITLTVLADLYETLGLDGRSEKYRQEQPVRIRRVAKHLGADRDVRSLCKSDVDRFTACRQAEGVRQGTIAADLSALKIALNWATEHKRTNGEFLIDANPLARVRLKREANPLRPIAKSERYHALKTVAHQLPAGFELALDLAYATGHRIGAILALRWEDVSFQTSKECPYGAIRWYAGKRSDNKKTEHVLPMNEVARQALERERERSPGIGAAWIFPSASDPSKHATYYAARCWMTRAEKVAGQELLRGGKWHPFRRGWATARKGHSLKDLAAAGGWLTTTMPLEYIHTDAETILAVVNG